MPPPLKSMPFPLKETYVKRTFPSVFPSSKVGAAIGGGLIEKLFPAFACGTRTTIAAAAMNNILTVLNMIRILLKSR
jgi:hypothetical protein